MNLKVPGAILPLGCAILSTRAKTVRGVGTTPLGELGLSSSTLSQISLKNSFGKVVFQILAKIKMT